MASYDRRQAAAEVFYKAEPEAHERALAEVRVDYPAIKVQEFARNIAFGNVLVSDNLTIELAGRPHLLNPRGARELSREFDAAAQYVDAFKLLARK